MNATNNMKILKNIILILITMITPFFIGCKDKNQKNQSEKEVVIASHSEEDLYRPNFHLHLKKAG